MKRIKFGSVKSFADVKALFTDNKELLKTAALPLVIGAAVLFFWFYGGKDADIAATRTEMDMADAETVMSIDGENNGTDFSNEMYVDISGGVEKPGVYTVKEGTRLFQVIEMAGGLSENADINSLNQAETVYDGQKIIVNTTDTLSNPAAEETSITGQSGITNGKVNLNLADSATLQTIPGIGPSKADRIIEYRKNSGKFKKIEDVKNITGIGEKTFESIKEHITV